MILRTPPQHAPTSGRRALDDRLATLDRRLDTIAAEVAAARVDLADLRALLVDVLEAAA